MRLFFTRDAIAIGRSHATVGARNDLIRCVTRSVVVAPRIETRDRDLVKRPASTPISGTEIEGVEGGSGNTNRTGMPNPLSAHHSLKLPL